MRLGLSYGHISSAGINRSNPGDNRLLLSLGIPMNF